MAVLDISSVFTIRYCCISSGERIPKLFRKGPSSKTLRRQCILLMNGSVAVHGPLHSFHKASSWFQPDDRTKGMSLSGTKGMKK
jgi:hypothetical protein